MIPLRDQNPGIGLPYVTLGLIIVTVAVYVFVQLPGGQQAAYEYATIPCEVTGGGPLDFEELETGICQTVQQPGIFEDKSVPLSLVASLFLHGGFGHLLANMWSLWIFGNNIGDALGRGRYLFFYLVAGVVATFAHVALAPSSVVPIIGASGAIAGVMGVYAVIFPRARITAWAVFVPLAVPAWVFMGIWFLSQFWIAATVANVAWEAHVGGFLFGAAVALTFRRSIIDGLADRAFQFVR